VIIAVASVKGGAGKTTTAVHLAAALAARRGAGPVALLDADASRAATRWVERGPGMPYAVADITRPPADAEHIVVDTPGAESAADLVELARAADRVIIPSPPSPLDLVGALDTLELLADLADVRVLLTRCPPRPQRDEIEARALLADEGARVLRHAVPNRKPYQAAALLGVTVRDARGGRPLWLVWPRIAREVTDV
jgi:chromosome partitioning protein